MLLFLFGKVITLLVDGLKNMAAIIPTKYILLLENSLVLWISIIIIMEQELMLLYILTLMILELM
ncbi:Uncharacterised protein [Streptococcus pneumoniae]|nr:Uncharacterised protein [Streptococcus pneumoniae]